MNIYIVEDTFDHLYLIKQNIQRVLHLIKSDWGGHYDSAEVYELFTPEKYIGDRNSEIDNNLVIEAFQHGPPHVIILDWDLSWQNNVELPGGELVRLIDLHSNTQDWNPYIIFTSVLHPVALLDILGGAILERMLPSSLSILEKDFFIKEVPTQRSLKCIQDALKQALEYASLNNIELTVFPLPNTHQYQPFLQTNRNNREIWKTNTAPFTHRYWLAWDIENSDDNKKVRTVLVKSYNIIAILKGTGDVRGIILWNRPDTKNPSGSLELLLGLFPSNSTDNYFIKRFPFLEHGVGVFYNENGIKKTKGSKLELNRNFFGEDNVNKILFEMSRHIQFAINEQKEIEETTYDSSGITDKHINRLQQPMQKFI